MVTDKQNNSTDSRGYLTGFFLALVLTVLAFGLVILATDDSSALSKILTAYFPALAVHISNASRSVILTIIFILAVLQVLIHLRYFLHLKFDSNDIINKAVILFSLLIIIILLGGSAWIMSDLNHLMMNSDKS
jgi:cytochrome o ubiquinol oxidase subunit IV